MDFKTLLYSNLPVTKKEWVWFILIILLVITLGMVAMNQYLAISYKAQLIQDPCSLCESFRRQMNSPIDLSKFKNITIGLP